MIFLSRLLSGFFVIVAVLLTVASLSADWVLEAWTVTDSTGNRISLLEAHRQGERLTREVHAVQERTSAKERISDMVADGQMSLIEAAAWFRALHQEPKAWNALHPRPGRGEGEGWCRMVVDWVEMRTRFERSPSQADALRDRLEAELCEHLEREGVVELPQ
jgi:hypothetical protein